MISDPVSDLLIRLKNANRAGKSDTIVPHSKLRVAILELLAKEGYVGALAKKGKKIKKTLEVALVYKDKRPAITGVKRISRPSRRVYLRRDEIHPVKFGQGIMVISTPKGLLTDKEARKNRVGGEAMFVIW